uniref:C-X-C motif chemokine n=1 Tax=Ursus americanus TaxID=9643 RepID=A0A452RSC7_URSAM
MSLRPNATSSCPSASLLRVLQGLLLLSLLLTTLVPWTAGESKRNSGKTEAQSVDKKRFVELYCMCLKTVSGIHPSNIQNLEVLSAGPHCPNVQVIATLKNGKKVCLDPEAPQIKKIVQKILESNESTA